MRRKSVLAIVLATILLAAAFACWPRKADLRAFDPAGMAQLETAMWRTLLREALYARSGAALPERDWAEIEGQLLRAYLLLKQGIGGS